MPIEVLSRDEKIKRAQQNTKPTSSSSDEKETYNPNYRRGMQTLSKDHLYWGSDRGESNLAKFNYSKENDSPTKTKFPWLEGKRKGVMWDFDPTILRDLAQDDVWVSMMVQSITKEVAQTPWTVHRVDDDTETAKRLSKSPFERQDPNAETDDEVEYLKELLSDPCGEYTWEELVEMILSDALTVGSMVVVKDFEEGAYETDEDGYELLSNPENYKPQLIRATDPTVWTKEYTSKGRLKYFWQFDRVAGNRQAGVDAIKFDPDEVAWQDLNPRSNRRYGLPPTLTIQKYLELLDLTVSQELDYFSRGMLASGALVLEEYDHEETKEAIQRLNDVKGKPHHMPIFAGKGGDINFEDFSHSYKDMEFNERQKWYAKVIASAFQVPVSVVGLKPEEVNRSTFQGERENFESNTLGPYLQKIERFVNNKITGSHFSDDIVFEFQPGMSEQSRSMISERVRAEYQDGIINQNEARREIGMDEVEGGDEFIEQESSDDDMPLPMSESDDEWPNEKSKQDEPLREVSDWQNFEMQPADVEDIKEKISPEIKDLWESILEDDQIDRLIEQFATAGTEKSLTGISREFGKLLSAKNLVDDIKEIVENETSEKAMETLQSTVEETDLDVDEDKVRTRLMERDTGFVNSLAQRMEDDLRETVADGWAEGKSTNEIKNDIRDKEDEFSDYQAERIARDQMQRATSEARNEFAQQHSDKFGEVWSAVGDDRTRPAHNEMDGKWKKPSEKYQVPYDDGSDMTEEKFPGDSENGIQCRCTTRLVDLEELDPGDHAGVA